MFFLFYIRLNIQKHVRHNMVLTFSIILLGMLLLLPPLRKNNFYIVHAGIVVMAAYFVETNYFTTTPFHQKTLLLFLVFHLASINLVTFMVYGIDKRAAKSGQRRIPENNMHTLEFLGGWIGALMGQKIFRHKTKKRSYQSFFWAMLVLEIGLIYVILKFLKII